MSDYGVELIDKKYDQYEKEKEMSLKTKRVILIAINKYYELPHSGHGLQNDDRISEQWMESIDEYLNKYMPVN